MGTIIDLNDFKKTKSLCPFISTPKGMKTIDSDAKIVYRIMVAIGEYKAAYQAPPRAIAVGKREYEYFERSRNGRKPYYFMNDVPIFKVNRESFVEVLSI